MSLLQLANELSLTPKRVASTHGGEYHSPCPSCGGKDRFIIWEKQGRYLCRQCALKGDAIQFCRDFMGMDYRSACAKVGAEPKNSFQSRTHTPALFEPQQAMEPSNQWQNSAQKFVAQSNKALFQVSDALAELTARGFTSDGKAAYRFWRSTYPNLHAWPISRGKSPGDALQMGVDLRQWIIEGLNQIRRNT